MHPRLQRIVTGSSFAGLEIQFLGEGMILHLLVLKKKGQQLVVEKSNLNIENLEKLSAHLAKDIPLVIAFTGKGVLHRRIAVDPASDAKLLLSKALPNASLKEFHLQTVSAAQDEQFVSVLRKSTADGIIEQLNQFAVIGCSLGPLSVITILSLLGETTSELRFGNHCLHLHDNLRKSVV